MHADPVHEAGGDSLSQEETALLAELDAPGIPHAAHSLLSVLMPATPPQPKNARVIRLFDFDAGANEPAPAAAAAPPEAPAPQEGVAQAVAAPAKPEPKSRDAAKAARNQSLYTAARLV